MTTQPVQRRISALLVSHDGARWLPQVLDGLAAQTRKVNDFVAVDTGSTDDSVAILRTRNLSVVDAEPGTAYADAVAAGLHHLGAGSEGEWIWLLHDDANPAPDALEQLLAAVDADPAIAVAGPKLREWPSLRRLLELGVTISGTGRRETGLERGEYDQGQHDRKRDVLAVNTAGMLVRREVLEQLGFDRRLPIFGNDVDFGWRAARAGYRVVVVPDAVVFHAEAAHRGIRRTRLTGNRFHRVEREAALYTLLVNGSGRGLPWRLLRLFLGSLLRILGFLLVRSPGEAWDEFVALAATYLRPVRIISGRRARKRTATVPHSAVKQLLAPAWLPYRHGLDFVSDVANAVVHQAADLTEARQQRRTIETGPVDEETESLEDDTGLVARFVTSPVAWAFTLLGVLALVAFRGHYGSGYLAGGALLPAPDSAGHWWSTLFAGSHHFGAVSTAPAAPALLPLAVAGSVLLGRAWLVVDVLLIFAVPLAAWGGFRFLRRLTRSWRVALWGGVAYGLTSVLSGAAQQGRLGTVVAVIVLPLLAHSLLFALPAFGVTPDRRWRAAFRAALWLALGAAFAPLLLVLAAVLLVVLSAVLPVTRPDLAAACWRQLVTVVVIAAILLLPWAAFMWWHHGGADWLFELGRPASDLIGRLSALDLATGRAGQVGSAPVWLSLPLVAAATAALVRSDTRSRVLVCWATAVVAWVLTAALSAVRLVDATTGVPERVWLGVPLVVAQGAAVVAVAIAVTGLRERLARHSFGWRQVTSALLTVVAVAATVSGLAWWAATGTGDVVDRGPVTAVPRYMTEAAASDSSQGVLVVRGTQRTGFTYQVLRERGLRLGDESVLPTAEQQQPLTDLVAALAASPDGTDVAQLGGLGVRFVYAPGPVDPQLAGNLDVVSGLDRASVIAPGARAWQLAADPDSPPPTPSRWWYSALVGLQCFVVVIVLVLAAPSRRRNR
ncbi:MAG: glycosyltransferase family 2 protein [Nocardioidaceae bacterium]